MFTLENSLKTLQLGWIDVNADKVYQTALNHLENHPELKLVEKDDKERLIHAETMIDRTKNEGKLKVTAIDAKHSQIIATGNLPGHDEEPENILPLKLSKIYAMSWE